MRFVPAMLVCACGSQPPPAQPPANAVSPPSIACPESLLRDFAVRVGDRKPVIRVEPSGPARVAKHPCKAELDPAQCEAEARASVTLAPGESISGVDGTANGGQTLGYDVVLVVDGAPERFRATTREQAVERAELHMKQGRDVTSFSVDEVAAPGDRIATVAIAGPTAPLRRIGTVRARASDGVSGLQHLQRDIDGAELVLLKYQRLDDDGTYELTVGCAR